MYSKELIDLLTIDLPIYHPKEPGFLDIIRQGHKEIVISRLYAYFLDYSNDSRIRELFINSLLEVLDDVCRSEGLNKNIKMEDFYCELEELTDNGNKIDLLLTSIDEKEAIIIENKVFHIIDNPFDDYWTKVKDIEDEKKIGILLTLKPIIVPPMARGKFINITHYHWIQKIKSKGLPNDLSIRHYVYINDFINNIESLTKANIMNDSAKFFFEHTEKVLTAIATKDDAKEFIVGQLDIAASKIGLNFSSAGRTWGEIWDGKSSAFYVIGYEPLLTGERKIDIIIQIYRDAFLKEVLLREALAGDVNYGKMYTQGHRGKGWAQFANRRYSLTEDDIKNLGEFIFNKIQQDFNSIMDIILSKLNETI